MKKQPNYHPKPVDLVGKRFGRLVIARRATQAEINSKKWAVWYLAICDCGRRRMVRSADVSTKTRPVKSCGCMQYQSASNKLPRGLASQRGAFHTMQSQGLRTRVGGRIGKEWNLSFDQFVAITSKPCAYCGVPWSRIHGGKKRCNGEYRFNGIDRIDSSKGYVLGNCAPCCWKCNSAKNSMSIDAFRAHLEKMYSHFILGIGIGHNLVASNRRHND